MATREFEDALQIVSDKLTGNNWHTLALMLDVFVWQVDPGRMAIELPDDTTAGDVLDAYEHAVIKLGQLRANNRPK
jgi:hypothetical protein